MTLLFQYNYKEYSDKELVDKITEKDVQPMMEIFADKETKRFMPELTEAIREER